MLQTAKRVVRSSSATRILARTGAWLTDATPCVGFQSNPQRAKCYFRAMDGSIPGRWQLSQGSQELARFVAMYQNIAHSGFRGVSARGDDERSKFGCAKQ